MGSSLQDQLRALGLAKEKPKPAPAQKARSGSGRRPPGPGKSATAKGGTAEKTKPGSGATTAAENISLEQAYRIREKEEKSAKQRAKERKMEEDRRRAAINKQIRQIVETHRLNQADASEARYFMYKERIRKVYASKEQLLALNEGSMGVVYLAGGYHILAGDHIEAVKQISTEHVADLLAGSSADDELWEAYERENSGAQDNGSPADEAGPEDR